MSHREITLRRPFGPQVPVAHSGEIPWLNIVKAPTEAIFDGILIEIQTPILQDAGIKLPSTMTVDLFTALDPREEEEEYGQTFSGRLWDMLSAFRAFAIDSNDSRIEFDIVVSRLGSTHYQRVVAVCGPDDDLSPCLTFMTPSCE